MTAFRAREAFAGAPENGLLLDVLQHECLPLLRIKRRQCALDVAADQSSLCRIIRDRRIEQRFVVHHPTFAPRALKRDSPTLIGDDRVHPRPEALRLGTLIKAAERPHPRVLQRLIGIEAVAKANRMCASR